MDQLTTNIITSLAVNYFTDFTVPVIKDFFGKAFQLKPLLEDKLKTANTTMDFEEIIKESVGVIDSKANIGSIKFTNAFLEAVRKIQFDHQNGTILITGTKMKAPFIHTGGTGNGKTTITNSALNSAGTRIDIGSGASIVISGNARIEQY